MKEKTIKTKTVYGTDVILHITARKIVAECFDRDEVIQCDVSRKNARELGGPFLCGMILSGARAGEDTSFEFSEQTIREINKTESELQAEEYKQRVEEIERKIPGVNLIESLRDELRSAHEYNEKVDLMRALDGFAPPWRRVDELETRFRVAKRDHPRAVQYIRAKAYGKHDDKDKSHAGKKAMAFLEAGGGAEEAEAILDNWNDYGWE